MAATIINLDEMIPEDRIVRFKGQDHKLEIATTETYLKVLKARKKLGGVPDDDEVAQTELALDMLVMALPSIPRNELMRLPLKAMMKLVDVVQNEMDIADVTGTPDEQKMIDVTPNGKEMQPLGESTLASSSPG